MTNVVKLEPWCGSWIAIDRETGRAVLETFRRDIAEKIDQTKYRVVTAYQHLTELNESIGKQA